MTETGNLDMQRADVETNAAIAIMEPYLQHLKQSGREDQVYGFRSGATPVESPHSQEIVDIIRVQVQVHQSNGATEVYEPAPHPDVDACDDSDPHASSSNAGTVAAVGSLDSMGCCPELARVGRWKLICKTPYARTCYGPPARRFMFSEQPSQPFIKARRAKFSKMRECSRCGAKGHNRGGGHCLMKSDDEHAMPRPRWLVKKGAKVSKHRGTKARLWRGSFAPHVRQPWDPPSRGSSPLGGRLASASTKGQPRMRS